MDEPPQFSIYGEAPEERDLGFVHVERVCDRFDRHRGHVQPHRHPHLHQVGFWYNGAGHYLLESQKAPLPAAAITLVPAGFVHGYEIKPPTDAIMVSIADALFSVAFGEAASLIMPLVSRPAILPLNKDIEARLRPLFEEILREYSAGGWASSHIIAAQVRLVMLTVGRMLDPTAGQADSPLARRFLALVDIHYRERWNVARYVEALGSTEYLLSVGTRRAFGKKPSELIRRRVVQEAQRLLHYTVQSVSEVGYMVGYEDPAHFGRMFKQATGLSPEAWRLAQLANDVSA